MASKLMMFLVLALTKSWCVPVGDFCPLQVGNEWVYSEYLNSSGSRIPTNRSYKVRKISIISKSISGDTNFYVANFRDSIFQRIVQNISFPDTIATFDINILEHADGTILPPNSSTIYFNRSFYDDTLVLNDTYGTTPVQSVTIGSGAIYRYFKDVGLGTFGMSISGGGGISSDNRSLISFNGNGFSSVFIRKPVVKNIQLPILTASDVMHFNALGRKIEKAGRYFQINLIPSR